MIKKKVNGSIMNFANMSDSQSGDNSITAFVEVSPAEATHSIGDYIIYNHIVYQVIDDIDILDILIVDSNIEVATLPEGTVIYSNDECGSTSSLSYNDLGDKPQIAGTTLQGNKSLADLGIASAEALTGKVDKVEGKGLSTNDYDDTEKGKVADNTGAIEAIVNVYGSKNLLPNVVGTQTKSGVTITPNADGSFTLSGKNTGTDDYFYFALPTPLPNSSYIQTYQGTDVTRCFVVSGGGPWIINREFTDSVVTLGIATDSADDFTDNPLTIYPMIRDARIADDTYVPYAMTNSELTERVTQSEFVSIGTDGVKTQKQLMQDLYALVDPSKISMQSKLVLNNANSLSFFSLIEKALDNRFLCFMRTAVSSAVGEVIETYQLGDGPAYAGKAYGGTEHETSSEVLSAGMSFTVYY